MSAATDQARLPERLEDAADQIFVRIGLPFPQHLAEAVPWFEPLGDTGLVRNMVADHPQFMAYVSRKLIEASERPASEWLDGARGNLLKKTPADYFSQVGEDTGILLGLRGDAYDAARALMLDELLPGHLEHGFFVAVPTRDVLVVLPVTRPGLVHVHI